MIIYALTAKARAPPYAVVCYIVYRLDATECCAYRCGQKTWREYCRVLFICRDSLPHTCMMVKRFGSYEDARRAPSRHTYAVLGRGRCPPQRHRLPPNLLVNQIGHQLPPNLLVNLNVPRMSSSRTNSNGCAYFLQHACDPPWCRLLQSAGTQRPLADLNTYI